MLFSENGSPHAPRGFVRPRFDFAAVMRAGASGGFPPVPAFIEVWNWGRTRALGRQIGRGNSKGKYLGIEPRLHLFHASSPHGAKRNAGMVDRLGKDPGLRFAPSGLRAFPSRLIVILQEGFARRPASPPAVPAVPFAACRAPPKAFYTPRAAAFPGAAVCLPLRGGRLPPRSCRNKQRARLQKSIIRPDASWDEDAHPIQDKLGRSQGGDESRVSRA